MRYWQPHDPSFFKYYAVSRQNVLLYQSFRSMVVSQAAAQPPAVGPGRNVPHRCEQSARVNVRGGGGGGGGAAGEMVSVALNGAGCGGGSGRLVLESVNPHASLVKQARKNGT